MHRIFGTCGRGLALGVAIAAVSGCAITPSGTASSLTGPSSVSGGYVVCSGGHASRFPGREEIGRACRRATNLQVIL